MLVRVDARTAHACTAVAIARGRRNCRALLSKSIVGKVARGLRCLQSARGLHLRLVLLKLLHQPSPLRLHELVKGRHIPSRQPRDLTRLLPSPATATATAASPLRRSSR